MGDHPRPVALPGPIRAFLTETIERAMSAGGRGPQLVRSSVPSSMPAGQVQRLCQGGPFGWLLDARVDLIHGRVVLEVCEDSRMAGMRRYRIWDDGSFEPLPAARDGIVFPPGCPPDEEERIRQEHYAHNRAVYERLAERGFRQTP